MGERKLQSISTFLYDKEVASHVKKLPFRPYIDTCNKARVKLFCIGRTQETLPTTSDAAKFHIMRSHYQASVWKQAHSPYPDLSPVTEMGWMHLDSRLVPRLLSLPPIPKACREITSCGCTKGCLSQRCSCRKLGETVVTPGISSCHYIYLFI